MFLGDSSYLQVWRKVFKKLVQRPNSSCCLSHWPQNFLYLVFGYCEHFCIVLTPSIISESSGESPALVFTLALELALFGIWPSHKLILILKFFIIIYFKKGFFRNVFYSRRNVNCRLYNIIFSQL